MKLLKKNQIIIYVMALMLITAGYLNYTTSNQNKLVETSMQMEQDDTRLADIGDAALVSSNDVVTSTESNNTMSNSISSNNTIENLVPNETANTIATNSTSSDEYFTKSKLERDTMYSQMLESYQKIIDSTNASETQKQTASTEITKINDTKNKIMITENLIKTKGFDNNIIFVNGESVSAIIGTAELSQEDVAQIQNIISREMTSKVENIHISNKK